MFSVVSENSIEIVTKKNIPKQGAYQPLGNAVQMYFEKYENTFPKLARCASVLLRWPTSSSALERNFSEISSHFTKAANRIHCETLSDIHHGKSNSLLFIKKAEETCEAHSIRFRE